MKKKVTIALDAMGGDFGPPVTMPAAVDALRRFPDLHWHIAGQRSALLPYFDALPAELQQRITLIDAPDVVLTDESPAKALRSKRNSSLWLALQCVAQNQASACISAGNTGALMAMARSQLGMIPGIDRPALVSPLPIIGGSYSWALDLGANLNCDAETLVQFALMGSALAEDCEGCTQPRVALLNVGSELTKGSDTVRHAASKLRNMPQINFVGYLEGHDLFKGHADVIVADGFAGNVALKTSEGLVQLILQRLLAPQSRSLKHRIVAKILKPLVYARLSDLNPDQYNGGSLLGLRGIVVKSHGNADQRAFASAIDQAVAETERNVPQRIAHRIETVLLDRD